MRYIDDLEYSQPQSLYAGEATNDVKALNSAMSNEYKETKNNKDILDLTANSLDVRDIDYGIKKKAIDDIKTKFEDLVKNGNYQDAGFLVKDAAKKFAMDKNIEGVKQSRAAELNYQRDLSQRLAKGDIDEETYLYKIGKSREKNQTPLSYDESTGLYKGMYSGETTYNDKSKEIYDLFNERGKDWKATEMKEVNGQRYKKIGGISGGYINMETGKEVTEHDLFQAFKTELRGRKDFKDYLDQEKEIDTHNITGGTGIIDKTTLNKVMSDDEIKARLIGTTPSNYKNIQNSKDEKAKKLVIEAERKFQNLDDSTIKNLFNDRYEQMQNNKYVSPSASKYSFEDFQDKQWENKPYLMALDDKYQRGRMAFKDEIEKEVQAPLPTNKGELENITGQEFIKQQEVVKNLDNKIINAKNAFELAKKTGKKELADQAEKTLNNLLHNKEDYNQNQVTLINNLKTENKKEVLTSLYDRVLNDKSFRDLLRSDTNFSPKLRSNLIYLEKHQNKEGDKDFFKDLYKETVNLLSSDNKNIDLLLNKALKISGDMEKNKTFSPLKLRYGGSSGKAYRDFMDESQINTLIADGIDEQSTVNLGNNSTVYGLDYNTDKKWERDIIDQVGSLVKTNPSGFNKNGVSLDQVFAGKSHYKFKDINGNDAIPDNNQSRIGFVTNNLNGDIQLKISFYDKDGKPLTRETNEGATLASMNFTPEDQEGIATAYNQLGNKLLKGDKQAQSQGANILGYTRFGKDLSLFRPTMQKTGDTSNATIDWMGKTRNIKFKVTNETSDGNKNFEAFDEKGNPIILENVNEEQKSTFGSKEEFYNNLIITERKYGKSF